jgi:hypothetical protein
MVQGVRWGRNRENHIYMCLYWKKNLLQIQQPISIKLNTNHAWVKGILNCSNKGPGPFQRGDNYKNVVGSFKNLLLNHWARIGHIYMKASWYNVHSELFTSWSRGSGETTVGKLNHIYMCLYWKKSSSSEPAGQLMSIKLYTNHP